MTSPGEVDVEATPRVPLSRERVLHAAVALADREGLSAVTMRRLADDLGVEAMSLYHHVANKEALLDGMVAVVMEEIVAAVPDVADGPAPGRDWQAALRTRALAARDVLLAHRWAPALVETRTSMGPAAIAYFEGVLGILREGGFSWDLAHHALHALGSRVLGFTRELFEPGDADGDEDTAMFTEMADQFPHLVGMLAEIAHDDPDSTLGWCDDQAEFEFGLDVLLDGLERRRAAD